MNRRLRYTVRFPIVMRAAEYVNLTKLNFGPGELHGLFGQLAAEVERPVVTVAASESMTPADAARQRIASGETLVSAEWVEIDGQETLL